MYTYGGAAVFASESETQEVPQAEKIISSMSHKTGSPLNPETIFTEGKAADASVLTSSSSTDQCVTRRASESISSSTSPSPSLSYSSHEPVLPDLNSSSVTGRTDSILVSGVFASTFSMNFFAEWGDKSQMAIILLAAQGNLLLVLSGALFGHMIAAGLAIMSGKLIQHIISERIVTLIGGIAFLSFAVLSLVS